MAWTKPMRGRCSPVSYSAVKRCSRKLMWEGITWTYSTCAQSVNLRSVNLRGLWNAWLYLRASDIRLSFRGYIRIRVTRIPYYLLLLFSRNSWNFFGYNIIKTHIIVRHCLIIGIISRFEVKRFESNEFYGRIDTDLHTVFECKKFALNGNHINSQKSECLYN